ESLDTIADVTLNGQLIKKARNCHVCHTIDVKGILKPGMNSLEIRFYSPVKYVKEKQAIEKCPRNNNGLTGIPHIRKPQCHFGWDWGPVLTPSGISGEIYLEAQKAASVSDIRITQTHEKDRVILHICGVIENPDAAEKTIAAEVVAPDGSVLHGEFTGAYDFSGDIIIHNPELWWTKELSGREKQPLYCVSVRIREGGEWIDSWSGRIGLRTISLNRGKDEFGRNFQFVLNGVPIFAKGANWIPADSFVNRVDKTKLEFFIRSAAESCFNMLRVWGGGYYESDDFYDLCDEYGILVWQDFCFACQPYPFFDEEFVKNVYEEIACNVTRLRHHASLCLWCG
ncbi:MAG: glycoside hydrolase family 2 protein, partial [Spirochaetota bacterium]